MNTNFKSYSSKSSAAKGAARLGFSPDVVYQDTLTEKWGFDVEVEATPETPAAPPAASPVAALGTPPEAASAPAEAGTTPPAPPADTSAKGTGLKIEKDRPEQNGVKRPSAGGMCRAVWDYCDATRTPDGTAPTVKQVKEYAVTQGWNENNASIEYYQWRKFNGITGRAKKVVPDATPEVPAARAAE